MSIAENMLGEFDNEMANTRKTLERLPEDKLEWKPDPKSMSMGRLAGHVAEMVGWGALTLTADSFDVDPDGTGSHKPLIATSRKQLLAEFDKNVAEARAALAKAPDSGMMTEWSLKAHGNTLMSMPRIAVIRSMVMNHIIHHRAQLTVYYRLNGVPVPALYGPSADEGQMPVAADTNA
jgi:uncharacterized damage-inducible protein DinB